VNPKDINKLADLIVGEMGKKDALAGDRGCFSSSMDFSCDPDFMCEGGTYNCVGQGFFDCVFVFTCATDFNCNANPPFTCPNQFGCVGPFNCGAGYVPPP